MKNVKKIVIYAVIVATVIGCAVIVRVKQSSTNKTKPTTAAVSSKTTVEVQDAKTVEESAGDPYKATLEAYQQGIVSSKVTGKIVTMSIENNGQFVNAGDTLITLDDQDTQNSIKAAQSQLQVYEDQLNT